MYFAGPQIESSAKLTQPESTLYRSLVVKLAHVVQDRIDVAEALKCLTRHMKEPRSARMQELKRLGRYLVRNRRCVLPFTGQTSDATLQVLVDSDLIGSVMCSEEKSTTGVLVRRGKQFLRNVSCLQTLVAPSSGEAECCALFRGGMNSIASPRVDDRCSNSNLQCGCEKCSRRRGIGARLRHLLK